MLVKPGSLTSEAPTICGKEDVGKYIMSQGAKTLFEKVWESHVVAEPEGEPALLYIDLHLLHEVTSPQAFEGLRLAGRTVRRPDRAWRRWIITFPPPPTG